MKRVERKGVLVLMIVVGVEDIGYLLIINIRIIIFFFSKVVEEIGRR